MGLQENNVDVTLGIFSVQGGAAAVLCDCGRFWNLARKYDYRFAAVQVFFVCVCLRFLNFWIVLFSGIYQEVKKTGTNDHKENTHTKATLMARNHVKFPSACSWHKVYLLWNYVSLIMWSCESAFHNIMLREIQHVKLLGHVEIQERRVQKQGAVMKFKRQKDKLVRRYIFFMFLSLFRWIKVCNCWQIALYE